MVRRLVIALCLAAAPGFGGEHECREAFADCEEDCTIQYGGSIREEMKRKFDKCSKRCAKTGSACIERAIETKANTLDEGSLDHSPTSADRDEHGMPTRTTVPQTPPATQPPPALAPAAQPPTKAIVKKTAPQAPAERERVEARPTTQSAQAKAEKPRERERIEAKPKPTPTTEVKVAPRSEKALEAEPEPAPPPKKREEDPDDLRNY